MKDYIDATPKPHFLNALRNAPLPDGVRTALGEFIDNSLGEGSGQATKVTLVYNKDTIVIFDNGRGMSDLAQMITLGDSQNRLSNEDIGNFGYGAKVGALYLGWGLEVHTVNEAGEYRFASVDWQEQEQKGTWHVPYKNKVYPRYKSPKEIKAGGTLVKILKRHDDRKWQWKSLAADLAHTFRPALEQGKQILLCHAEVEEIDLSDTLIRDELRGKKTFSGVVKRKTFSVVAGERADTKTGRSGIHIAFGHRIIETVTKVGDTKLPHGFCATVQLDSAWKQSLSSVKNRIEIDREALLEEVVAMTKHIIEAINVKSREIRMEIINAQIAQQIASVLSKSSKKNLAKHRYWEPSLWTRSREGDDEPEEGMANAYGLSISLEDLGEENVWDATLTKSKVSISINKNIDFVRRAYNHPVNSDALWFIMSGALCDAICRDDVLDCLEVMKLSSDDLDLLRNYNPERRRQMMMHRFLDSAPSIKEPTKKEIEEAIKGESK